MLADRDSHGRHIVAMGGLSRERDNGPLLEYCLKLADTSRPKVGFIATASGDAPTYVQRFEEIIAGLICEPSHLPLFARTPDVSEWVKAQDVILVGGGNTKSMLAVWREWDLPALLRDAWDGGTVLCGWSAGAICWFEQASLIPTPAGWVLNVLGFLPGSCCPHYNGQKLTVDKPITGYSRRNRIPSGIAIDDCVSVHFVDQAPWQIVRLENPLEPIGLNVAGLTSKNGHLTCVKPSLVVTDGGVVGVKALAQEHRTIVS
ncbi:MAG: peptidase E [Planctomycetaceae bacterium]